MKTIRLGGIMRVANVNIFSCSFGAISAIAGRTVQRSEYVWRCSSASVCCFRPLPLDCRPRCLPRALLFSSFPLNPCLDPCLRPQAAPLES